MHKCLLTTLSCLILSTCPVLPVYPALYAAEAYEEAPVGNIDIVAENLAPNASFDAKRVLSKLKTKVGDPFSQTTFDSDLKTLAEEYDRVEPQLEVHNGEVYVTLRVWARPLIRTIKWNGNTHVKTKTLQK